MPATTDRSRLPVAGQAVDAVTAVVHRPDRATETALLLTHGAGGDLDAEGLVALADGLAQHGYVVVRCNLPYREAGRRAAPRAGASVGPFLELAAAARELVPTATRWIHGGKSYGGRVASMAAATGELGTAGLLFYGYPLHAPGKADRLRVEHWPDVPVPSLFLQGTRDTFSDPELLADNVRRLPRRATVHVVEGGDHSLRITKAASPDGRARRPAAVLADLVPVVVDWLSGLD